MSCTRLPLHSPQEFAAGKHLLSGEYLLPSGQALPFGAMVAALKRGQMLRDVIGGGGARDKWAGTHGGGRGGARALRAIGLPTNTRTHTCHCPPIHPPCAQVDAL